MLKTLLLPEDARRFLVRRYAKKLQNWLAHGGDNEFTEMAMNIFKTFGFQTIVATPLKSVMTLELFIGGACFVHIRDRKHSSVMQIEYDTASHRLNLSSNPHEPQEAAVSV